jgi:hypothetical protein
LQLLAAFTVEANHGETLIGSWHILGITHKCNVWSGTVQPRRDEKMGL